MVNQGEGPRRGDEPGGGGLGGRLGGAPGNGGGPFAMEPGDEQEVYVLTRKAVREVDRLATEEFGIPSIVLMENAAFHVADLALHLLSESETPRILVMCGPGNNGGDGLAAARHLHNAGAEVWVVHAGPARDGSDAAVNLAVAERMGLSIARVDGKNGGAAVDHAVRELGGRPDLVIDALLGTGLDRPVREPELGLIGRMNELAREGTPILAVDIPSGLDADTGEALGAAVKANVTVSLVGLKAGFTKLSAQGYIGDVVVSDIGAPRELTLRLGTVLATQEAHEGPPIRPGHEPGGPPPERRPDRL